MHLHNINEFLSCKNTSFYKFKVSSYVKYVNATFKNLEPIKKLFFVGIIIFFAIFYNQRETKFGLSITVRRFVHLKCVFENVFFLAVIKKKLISI